MHIEKTHGANTNHLILQCHIDMKQLSRKRKGKRLQNLIRSKLLETFPHLKAEDVRVAATGENGCDVKLSKIAKRLFPYQVESKNQEKFRTLYSFWRQTKKHGKLEPVLICKMNGEKPLAVIDLDHFFSLVK